MSKSLHKLKFNELKCNVIIGDFAYLGTFRHDTGQVYSIKVIAKYKAAQRRMDMRLLDERIFLSALQGE